MGTTSPDSIVYPDSTSLFSYTTDLASLANSVQSAITSLRTNNIQTRIVANTAARTAYLAAFGTPTASNPCAVYRVDASPGLELEINRGSGWSVWVSHRACLETIFTSSGTYTPLAGFLYAEVIVVGGGGGGGGAATSGAGSAAAGTGGGGGGYTTKQLSASAIGASQTVTVGAGGAGGVAGANDGALGGTSSFGALLTATGGDGGTGASASSAAMASRRGGTGGVGSLGSLNLSGKDGGSSFTGTDVWAVPSFGGDAGGGMGMGAQPLANSGIGTNGVAGKAYGGGGSGGFNRGASGTTARSGGAGANGIVIVREYY